MGAIVASGGAEGPPYMEEVEPCTFRITKIERYPWCPKQVEQEEGDKEMSLHNLCNHHQFSSIYVDQKNLHQQQNLQINVTSICDQDMRRKNVSNLARRKLQRYE